jgi:TonB family protein
MKRLAGLSILVLASAVVMPLKAADQEVAKAPIVLVCVDEKGQLLSADMAESSGSPDLDQAALKVAQASKFSPAKTAAKKPPKRSCVKFRVKFVVRDGETVPAEG